MRRPLKPASGFTLGLDLSPRTQPIFLAPLPNGQIIIRCADLDVLPGRLLVVHVGEVVYSGRLKLPATVVLEDGSGNAAPMEVLAAVADALVISRPSEA